MNEPLPIGVVIERVHAQILAKQQHLLARELATRLCHQFGIPEGRALAPYLHPLRCPSNQEAVVRWVSDQLVATEVVCPDRLYPIIVRLFEHKLASLDEQLPCA